MSADVTWAKILKNKNKKQTLHFVLFFLIIIIYLFIIIYYYYYFSGSFYYADDFSLLLMLEKGLMRWAGTITWCVIIC